MTDVLSAFSTDFRLSSKPQSKLEEFRSLPDGWHFGEGVSATPKAYTGAHLLLNLASIWRAPADVFPEAEGGILLVAYDDGGDFEILCRADGSFDLILDFNDEEVLREEGVSRFRALEVFQKVLRYWLNSSGSFTPVTSMKSAPVLSVSHLNPEATNAFQSYRRTA